MIIEGFPSDPYNMRSEDFDYFLSLDRHAALIEDYDIAVNYEENELIVQEEGVQGPGMLESYLIQRNVELNDQELEKIRQSIEKLTDNEGKSLKDRDQDNAAILYENGCGPKIFIENTEPYRKAVHVVKDAIKHFDDIEASQILEE